MYIESFLLMCPIQINNVILLTLEWMLCMASVTFRSVLVTYEGKQAVINNEYLIEYDANSEMQHTVDYNFTLRALSIAGPLGSLILSLIFGGIIGLSLLLNPVNDMSLYTTDIFITISLSSGFGYLFGFFIGKRVSYMDLHKSVCDLRGPASSFNGVRWAIFKNDVEYNLWRSSLKSIYKVR